MGSRDRAAPSVSASWEAWAPPLAPPADGGLPRDEAQEIADPYWDASRTCARRSSGKAMRPRCRELPSPRWPPGCSPSATAGRFRAASWARRWPAPSGTGHFFPGWARYRCAWFRRTGTRAAVRGCRIGAVPSTPGRMVGVMRTGRRRSPGSRRCRRAGQRRGARSSPRFPWCQDCGLVPATEVHHVISRAAGGGDEPGNLRSALYDLPRPDYRVGRAARRGRKPRWPKRVKLGGEDASLGVSASQKGLGGPPHPRASAHEALRSTESV